MISLILLELTCSGRYLFARAHASRKRGMVLSSDDALPQGAVAPELSHEPRHPPAEPAAELPRWAEVHLRVESERSGVRSDANGPSRGAHLRNPLGFGWRMGVVKHIRQRLRIGR